MVKSLNERLGRPACQTCLNPVLLFSYSDLADQSRIKCVEGSGDTVSSRHLLPLLGLNLTVHLKSGGKFSTPVCLENIGECWHRRL